MYKPMDFVEKSAWRYSIRKNVFTVIKGVVGYRETKKRSPSWDRIMFVAGESYHDPNHEGRYKVAREEGTIRNESLWLSERDDEKAFNLFVEDKKKRIRGYEKRIANLKRDLEIIESNGY